jgi:hypothetical protein
MVNPKEGAEMAKANDIFEKNYQDYCRQVAALDIRAMAADLGIEETDGRLTLPFFDETYWVSERGVLTLSGNRPDYTAAVILSKYLLMSPSQSHEDLNWASFRDFKAISHFTNLNYFSSDTEKAIEHSFAGRLDALAHACQAIGGVPEKMPLTYDLSIRFDALPRIAMLLLFNDKDEEFPAKCTVLFQKHAEAYLDPESLAVCGAHLARRLKTAAKT